jgi:hypothetical protein
MASWRCPTCNLQISVVDPKPALDARQCLECAAVTAGKPKPKRKPKASKRKQKRSRK